MSTVNTSSEDDGLPEPDTPYSYNYVVVMSVVLILELLIGLVFNIIVLIIYHSPRRPMHSAGDLFITNMNIVDILISSISITMTITLLLTTTSIPLFCYFHEATVSFASTATAVNVLIISLDRRDKILRPLSRRFTNKNAAWITLFTWCIGLGGLSSPFFGINTADLQKASESSDAVYKSCYYWFSVSRHNYYYELYHIPIFFMASLVMIFAYYSIIKVARRGRSIHTAFLQATLTMQPAAANVSANHKDPEKRVSMTTSIIITTFIICWGPHTCISIAIISTEPSQLYETIQLSLLALAYSTTLTHPILYVFMKRNFRSALKQAFCVKCQSRNRVMPHTASEHHTESRGAIKQPDNVRQEVCEFSSAENERGKPTVPEQQGCNDEEQHHEDDHVVVYTNVETRLGRAIASHS